MSLQNLTSEQKQRLYDVGGFLCVEDLPTGAEFSIDGSVWQVDKFAGIKLLPVGFHLATFAAPPSKNNTDAEMLAQGLGIRKAMLYFSKPRQITTRKWVDTIESVVPSVTLLEQDTDQQPKKRRRTAKGSDTAQEEAVSRDFLKSIDHMLAPYPLEKLDEWQSLTSFIDETCVARVVGFDQNAEARLDSLTPDSMEAEISKKAAPLQWGKPRPVESQAEGDPVDPEESLHFAKFDLRRSWPPGSFGEDLTRYSRDKSWLLAHVIKEQTNDDPRQFFGEIQLAFVFLTLVQNHSALESYKRNFSLIFRSLGSRGFMAEFINNVLAPQLRWVREEFFALDLPEIESFYTTELDWFRQAIWSGQVQVSPDLITAWSQLAQLTSAKFGWDLAPLDKATPSEKKRTMHYDLLRERQGPDDDLLAEEGDDQPVIVDLGDFA